MTSREQNLLYSVHPSVAYAQAIINNLPEKTGKSISEWVALIQESGPSEVKEIRDWLKAAHKLGSTTAWMIADRAVGKGREDTDEVAYLTAAARYVEEMYAGPKAALRPLHDALIDLARSLGADVRICPCQTIVPLYRQHVFAQIKPSTRTRIDFGLSLKGAPGPLSARLIETGGLQKGDRITHRFAISSPADITSEVKKWAKIAYELDT